MNHTPVLVSEYSTDALTFSLCPPLRALPQNHIPKKKIPVNVNIVCVVLIHKTV